MQNSRPHNKLVQRRRAQLVVAREVLKHLSPLLGYDPAQPRQTLDTQTKRSVIRVMRALGLSTTVIGSCLHHDHTAVLYHLRRGCQDG